jgi:WD40 repeat protein
LNTESAGLLEIQDTKVFQAWRPTNSPGRPLGFVASPDGNFLASIGFTGVQLWDAQRARFVLSFPTTEVRVSGITFLNGGDEVSLLVGDDGTGYVEQSLRPDPQNPDVGPRLAADPPRPWLREAGWILESLSPDGKRVALCSRSGARPAIIVARDDPSQRVELKGQKRPYAIVFNRDGSLAASASRAQDGIAVWNANTGALIRRLEENADACVAFDPTDRWLVTGSLRGYQLWNLRDWQPGPHLDASDLTSWAAAFSPDGRYIAILKSGDHIGIYDAASATHLADLMPPFSIAPSFVKFSGDGRWLNVLGIDQTIQRWDLVALREELQRFGLAW